MIILETQVKDSRDSSRTGKLICRHPYTSEPISVTYTTPFLGTGGAGGFVAIPMEGAKILITQPDNSNDFFYLSTISSPSNSSPYTDSGKSEEDQQGEVLPTKDIYEFRGRPTEMGLWSRKGHFLALSDAYNSEKYNIKLSLESSLGKKLIMDDSPESNGIVLLNEHGDGLRLTTEATRASAARSFEIKSDGPQDHICLTSEMNFMVVDGKELNIINNSTGQQRPGIDPITSQRYGNINMTSRYRDINITARGGSWPVFSRIYPGTVPSRIFINCLGLPAGSLVQIHCNGQVRIDSEMGIDMHSKGFINIRGEAGVNIDGASIHLNENKTAGIVATNIPNYYGD